jgi:hypothetical protein
MVMRLYRLLEDLLDLPTKKIAVKLVIEIYYNKWYIYYISVCGQNSPVWYMLIACMATV